MDWKKCSLARSCRREDSTFEIEPLNLNLECHLDGVQWLAAKRTCVETFMFLEEIFRRECFLAVVALESLRTLVGTLLLVTVGRALWRWDEVWGDWRSGRSWLVEIVGAVRRLLKRKHFCFNCALVDRFLALQIVGDVDLLAVLIVKANVSDPDVNAESALHFEMFRAEMTLKSRNLTWAAWLSSCVTVGREIVHKAQMQTQQILIHKHKAADFATETLIRRFQWRRQFRNFYSALFWFRLFFRFWRWRRLWRFICFIVGWQWVSEQMNRQFVESEEDLVAERQRTLDWLAVHFNQIQLECLDVRKLGETAQRTRQLGTHFRTRFSPDSITRSTSDGSNLN